MTKQELKNWCKAHAGQARRTIYSNSSGYKYLFEDGSTYTYHSREAGIDRRLTTIYINGREVYKALFKHIGFGDWKEVTS